MDDEGWEARMAERARQRRHARGEFNSMTEPDLWIAQLRAEQMAEHPERFSPIPPDDDTCRACNEWRIENASMGRYSWWLTCYPGPCECCHCENVVLMAAAS